MYERKKSSLDSEVVLLNKQLKSRMIHLKEEI